jgi:drug/metabolite transporter (DMT)-like permease
MHKSQYIAQYLPFLNAVLYAVYYVFLQEIFGKLSLSVVLLTNGLLFTILALLARLFSWDDLSFAALKEPRMLWSFVALIALSIVLQVTHYFALKNTSATYMAFAEISYPLFIPIFAYLLFARQELSPSISIGGGLILLGSIIIARGGVAQ